MILAREHTNLRDPQKGRAYPIVIPRGFSAAAKVEISFELTDRAQGGLLDDGKAAVVDRQVADVQSQEHVLAELGEVVVAQLQVVDDGVGSALKDRHGAVDMLALRGLTQNVQTVLFHAARARRDFGRRRTLVLIVLRRDGPQGQEGGPRQHREHAPDPGPPGGS